MKNKKITIHLDVNNKRVRKGFQEEPPKGKTEKENKKIKNSAKQQKRERNNHRNSMNQEEIRQLSDGIEIVNKHKKKLKQDREKRIGKTKKELEIELEKKNEEEITFKPVMISLVTIIIIILLYCYFQYAPIFGIGIKLNRAEAPKQIDIVSTESDYYDMYQEELLVYSNQTFTTYDKNGKKTWSYSLDQMFTPEIYIQDKYMVVTNNASGYIYMFENKKEILNKKIEGKIGNIYLDTYGNIAVEYASNGYKKIVGIYNKNGENIYNAHLDNSTIADIKLLENGKKLLVTKVISSSFKSGIEVDLVDSTKQEENIKEVIKLDNNFIYDLTLQGQNIIMLLDNKLLSVNMDTSQTKEIKDFESSQILYFTLSDNYYTCVEKTLNEENDFYKINSVRYDGTLISTMDISNSPKLLKNSGFLNYFVYQDKYSIVNKWGIEVESKNLKTLPKDIIVFNHEKSLALIYTNRIYIENL